jgi:predicted ATPase
MHIIRIALERSIVYESSLLSEQFKPLSFVSCLSLVALLHDLASAGSQLVIATHSPVVAAVPGARILELGDWGIRPASWDDLEIVQSWRMFLGNPRRFLRYLLSDESAEQNEGVADPD